MTKKNAHQAGFSFLEEMDRKAEAQRLEDEEKRKLANEFSWLKSAYEQYPPTAEEWDIMLSGIRLARFVGFWDCRDCPFDTSDHTMQWLFPTFVCLKDAYSHGYKREWNPY